MTTTAMARHCSAKRQPSEMTLDGCLLQLRLAELVVLSCYRRLSHALRCIGISELTTVTRLEQVILFARGIQQAMRRACCLLESQTVPWAVCDASPEYRGAWAEPQALVDDLILYASSYQDVLENQELNNSSECRQRQVVLRTQHVHLLRALVDGFRWINVWKAEVRQDDSGQNETDEGFDDESLVEG